MKSFATTPKGIKLEIGKDYQACMGRIKILALVQLRGEDAVEYRKYSNYPNQPRQTQKLKSFMDEVDEYETKFGSLKAF